MLLEPGDAILSADDSAGFAGAPALARASAALLAASAMASISATCAAALVSASRCSLVIADGSTTPSVLSSVVSSEGLVSLGAGAGDDSFSLI